MIDKNTLENKPFSFFETTSKVFQETHRNVEIINRFYSVGGYPVKLQFAGHALIPLLTPALDHLVIDQTPSPSLTICLWDSESTGTYMPSPPWSLEDYFARGEIKDYNNNNIFTACNKGSGALSILNKNFSTGLWWIRNACEVPFYESGSPLLMLFHWWLRHKQCQVVHAGAVGTKDAGVLLVGKGGSGKSSTTITCLNSELLYAGDDYCILTTTSVPSVFSLYSSGKLDANHIKKFPHLLPIVNNKDRTDVEKPLLFFNQHYSEKIVKKFPIRAIFLPRITGLPDTTLTPTTQAVALKALAPNTLFQLLGADSLTFHEIAKFVRQVPCYYLNLGTELDKIPLVISKFLSEG